MQTKAVQSQGNRARLMNIFKIIRIDKHLFTHLHYWGKAGHYHFYFSPDFKNAEDLLHFLIDPVVSPDIVFPTRKRRRVFVAHTGNGEKVLCKQFLLWRHKKNCFHVNDFAYKEVVNHMFFSSFPYLVPKIYGYYEKRVCGLPVECGMFMSYLEGFERLQAKEYMFATRMILALSENGVFHGDLSPKNILIKKQSGELALIDMDSVSKCAPYSWHHLVRMAGNYLYSTQYMYPDVLDQDDRLDFITLLYQELPESKRAICGFDAFRDIILEIARHIAWEPLPEEIFEKNAFFSCPQ